MNNFKIVSGGQTGVDRGALDAALELNIPCGGWCPEGRKAEDGVIPEQYPLQELKDGDYEDRTRKNVLDSDASAIIYFGELEGGTEQTLDDCVQNGRPYILIDGSDLQPGQAAKVLADFVRDRSAAVLNVAGPRASKSERGHKYALDTIRMLVDSLRHRGPSSGKRADGGRGQQPGQRNQPGRGGGGRPEGQRPQQGQPGGGGKRGKNRGRSRGPGNAAGNPNAGGNGGGNVGGNVGGANAGGNPQANNQKRRSLGQHYRAKHGVNKEGNS